MKKMNLNNIHEWPLMTRVLLLGLVFAVTIYAGYRFDLKSQIQQLLRVDSQESELKQQIELVIRKNKMIHAEVKRLPELQATLLKWKNQLVTYNDLPELLNDILKLGGDNHLFFSLFTPGESVKITMIMPPVDAAAADASAAPVAAANAAPDAAAGIPVNLDPKVSYGKVPIKVVVVGSYHQIADFISQVANMPKIVAIGNFTFSNENQTTLLGEKLAKQAEAQHLLSAEMTLVVYHMTESK